MVQLNIYKLLDRMASDCDYVLHIVEEQLCSFPQAEKHLWAGDVSTHISTMRKLYSSFPADKRPDWLSSEQIDEYERRFSEFLRTDLDDSVESRLKSAFTYND